MNDVNPDDSLNGIPNLGPARRAALEAAGVTTRAQLAGASGEQLVAMTGMARSLAEKTLEFVRHAAPVIPAPAPDAATHGAPERDEAVAPVPGDLPPAPEPEDGDPGVDAQANLEQQVVRAQTALSDLTRLVGDKSGAAFLREAERLSNLLDAFPGPLGVLRPKRVRRLAAEVEATAAQIELLARSKGRTGKKAQQRYAAILRDDRRVLEAKRGKVAVPKEKKAAGGKKPGRKK